MQLQDIVLGFGDHSSPLAYWLHWLRDCERIQYKHSLLAFRSINQLDREHSGEFLEVVIVPGLIGWSPIMMPLCKTSWNALLTVSK